MNNYFIRKNIILNFIKFLSFFIFAFFISHIFFGDRSIWKIFSLNSEILAANKEYTTLTIKKEKVASKIDLLRDTNLDADYVAEISYDLLGLIQSDQIVIDIKK